MKRFTLAGAVLAFTAVLLGALGAHALEKHVTPEQLDAFETGVRYQFFHALALIVIAGRSRAACWCMLVGTLLFSGSIYLLSCRELLGINAAWLGPITPLGGLTLMAGWICFILAVARQPETT